MNDSVNARMSRAIAVIGGTGPAGTGLALRWARAGETVIIGSRDAARAQQTAETIRKRAGANAQVSGMENSAACAASDLLVLTVPFDGQAALLKQLKTAIRPGSILIDATVPLAASIGGRASRTLGVWQGSAAQQTAEPAFLPYPGRSRWPERTRPAPPLPGTPPLCGNYSYTGSNCLSITMPV